MATKFAGLILERYIRQLFRDNVSVELALKVSQAGDLSDFPAIKTLASHVPAAFTKATRCVASLKTVNAGTWLDEYYFRVVAIFAIPEDQTEVDANRFKVERLADTIREHHNASVQEVTGLPSGVQQLHLDVTEIEYRPPEDNLDEVANARMNAMAMTVKASVLSTVL